MKNEERSDAIGAFRRYAQAFQALDARALAQHFNEPALSITPRGLVALPTRAAVEHEYGLVMADLPARGYARTDFSPLTARVLSDDLTVVSGAGTWKKASGEDLMRFGMTYTLRRTEATWLIVVAIVHDPDASV